MAAHPDVASWAKELHYFQHQWDQPFTDEDIELYHRYFPRPPGMLAGEWTPRYMLDPWTPARLARAAPRARVLVLLRDPLARYRSGVSHYLARHPRMHPRAVTEAIQRGCYGSQIAALRQHFGPGQILVLQLERCSADPETEIGRTYRFLGLDPGYRPDGLHQRIFAGHGPSVDVPADLAAQLRALYGEEARMLARMCPDIDLGLWPSVS